MKIFTLGLIFTMWLSVLFATGCPAETTIRKSARASYQLSGLTLDAVRATKTAYVEGIITLEQKDRLADKLIVLSRGGQAFNAAVKGMSEAYKSSGEVPPDKLKILEKLFDDSVVSPFLAFLAELKIVGNVPQLAATIKLLSTAVLTIARVFGRETVLLRNHAPPFEMAAHKIERVSFAEGAKIHG